MPNAPFRLAWPRRRWVALRWHPDDHVRLVDRDPPVRRALEELDRIPGCNVEPGSAAVPHTAYRLDVWRELLARVGLLETFDAQAVRDARATPVSVPEGLYPWQAAAAAQAVLSGGLLLADDMGLGKTRSAIAAAIAYRNEEMAPKDRRPNLVIAPGFTREVWRRELAAMGELSDPADFCALQTRSFDDASYRRGARWYFVHYDVVFAWSSKINQSLRPAIAIVDEVHYCKNGRAQRSKGTQVAAGCASLRIALTGTPLDNSPAELWMPLQIVTGARTWGTPIDFRRRYCGALRGQYGWQDQGPSNVAELRKRLEPYYLRRTLDDIDHALPPLRRERVEVSMGAADAKAHAKALTRLPTAELVDALLQGRAGTKVFELLHKLRQRTSRAKFKTTLELAHSLQEQGESVVVFVHERATAERLWDQARSRPVYLVHGGVSQCRRDEHIDEFMRWGGVLFATYGALREGVTLTRARAVVLHDLDWTTSTILQAEKRIHRLSQSAACMSYWMVAEDSIDTIFAKLLTLKAEWIEDTLGIDAPARAVDDVDLGEIAPQFDASSWARTQLERWTR